jgi:adenylate kinase family enzyme
MTLTIPKLSFVVLIGVSGSGKSTFARKHFKPTEILSSDFCRALVSDDENDDLSWAEVKARRKELPLGCKSCLTEAELPESPDDEASNRFLVKARLGAVESERIQAATGEAND